MSETDNKNEASSASTEEVEALRREVEDLRNALALQKEKQKLQTELASLKQELSSENADSEAAYQQEDNASDLNRSIAISTAVCLILSILNSIAARQWIHDPGDLLYALIKSLSRPRSFFDYLIQGSVPAIFIPAIVAGVFYFIKKSKRSAKKAFRAATIVMAVVIVLGGNFGVLR